MSAPLSRPTAVLTEHKETHRMISRIRLLFALALALLATAVAPGAASAAGPELTATSMIPDHVEAGKSLAFWVRIGNTGDEPLSGNLTIKYTFPDGVFVNEPNTQDALEAICVQSGQVEECAVDATGVPPDRWLVYPMFTFVEPGATGTLTGEIEISGGGAANVVTIPLSLNTEPIGPFAIKSLDVGLSDGPVVPATQAGAVPADVSTGVELLSRRSADPEFPPFTIVSPPESTRDVIAHIPAGFVGNPNAVLLRCTAAQLAEAAPGSLLQVPLCPQDSQIGTALVNGKDLVPLYNLVAPEGVPAEFGFYYLGVVVTLHPELRPSDNGIDIVSETVPSSIPIPKFEATFWGVPADTSHDRLRALCTIGMFGNNGSLCPSAAPKAPFLRLPTSCSGGPLPWSVDIDTYQNPGVFHHRDDTTPALEGCDHVPFEPKASVAPSERSAGTPTGLDVDLSLPQSDDPNRVAQGDVRSATVHLPQGITINPAAADGLAACTDEQLRLGQEGPAQCPDGSKLGSLELKTPLLEEPIAGSVVLRSQASQDPASGEMYRLAIILHSDEYGIDIKLPGSLKADPATGQLTTRFDDLPQLPFESMQLHLNSGPRAPLTNPSACGTYTTESELSSWARPNESVPLYTSFSIGGSCDTPGFDPGFEAGSTDPSAGEFSPFVLRVTRDARQPNLSRIDATLPEGEVAKLAGVAVCSDGQAASGDCPAGSRIGRVVAAVGEGSSPLYIPQPGKAPTAVYFAGPYKGAPYSLLAEVPAQSGPFDLGTVLVRSAVDIDPTTAQVSVRSDTLPQIFGGIPVSYRDVRVEVDRPEYTLNPTDCEPTAVTGSIGSIAGQSVDVSDRFQVTDCAALGFKPKLSIGLEGKTRRGGNPALTAVLQMPKGGANIARTSVALPHSEFLAQSHINTSCTRVQYAAGGGGGAGCPKGSVYGHARAFSPLLDYPLEGPVYLRSNGGERELPDLVASLGGQIHVDLVGYIDSDKKTGGLRTTFGRVPDAPVTKFVLKMPGGRKSLLENSTNICRGMHRAIVKMDGQNGKVHDFRPLVRARCGKKAR